MARWLCVNEIPLLKSALEGLEKLSATSQEAQGPLDTEDKQEEEDEIGECLDALKTKSSCSLEIHSFVPIIYLENFCLN